jgi:hypothetical protein
MPIYERREAFEPGCFDPEEYVVATEIVYGRHARFCFSGGHLLVGGRGTWFSKPTGEWYPEIDPDNEGDIRWEAAMQAGADWGPAAISKSPQTPLAESIEEKLEHPDVADKLGFYTQVYDIPYRTTGPVDAPWTKLPRLGLRTAFFDAVDLKTGKLIAYPEFLAVCQALNLETAPLLYTGQFKAMDAQALANGVTEVRGRARRFGIIVRPLLEVGPRAQKRFRLWRSNP